MAPPDFVNGVLVQLDIPFELVQAAKNHVVFGLKDLRIEEPLICIFNETREAYAGVEYSPSAPRVRSRLRLSHR